MTLRRWLKVWRYRLSLVPPRLLWWRRRSSSWAYLMCLCGWLAATYMIGRWPLVGREWPVWLVSIALFLMVFEVGIQYVLAVAWFGHRQLELEGEKANQPEGTTGL